MHSWEVKLENCFVLRRSSFQVKHTLATLTKRNANISPHLGSCLSSFVACLFVVLCFLFSHRKTRKYFVDISWDSLRFSSNIRLPLLGCFRVGIRGKVLLACHVREVLANKSDPKFANRYFRRWLRLPCWKLENGAHSNSFVFWLQLLQSRWKPDGRRERYIAVATKTGYVWA